MITQSEYWLDHVNYSKYLFESIPQYRRIVLIVVLTKIDVDLSKECGFWKQKKIKIVFEKNWKSTHWKERRITRLYKKSRNQEELVIQGLLENWIIGDLFCNNV